jgi:hypothetical protein
MLKHRQVQQVQAQMGNETKDDELKNNTLQTPQSKHVRQVSAPNIKLRYCKRPRLPLIETKLSKQLNFHSRENSVSNNHPVVPDPVVPFEADDELQKILIDFCKFTTKRTSNEQVVVNVDNLDMYLQGKVPLFLNSIKDPSLSSYIYANRQFSLYTPFWRINFGGSKL